MPGLRPTTAMLVASVLALGTACGVTQAPAAAPEAGSPDATTTQGTPATAATPPNEPAASSPLPSAPLATPSAQLSAAAVTELPGGGTTIFGGKTYVALYGFPGSRALGVLGEQGTAATVTRAKKAAAKYRPYTKRTVVPALEILATVASAYAGPDKDYSAEATIETLRPLVDAAGKAGVYVVLDLQPGRSSFLSQAKRYQELLMEPHVGLALDPEWRLKPNQKHLRQIGSVDVAEVNQVADWLATMTRTAGLPQKMLLLHQFRTSMIHHRSALDTDHPELAFAVQMDGQGGQGAKQETWAAIRRHAPSRVVFGWKNFYDEDHPMLSPKATMRIKPQPRWVSYQ